MCFTDTWLLHTSGAVCYWWGWTVALWRETQCSSCSLGTSVNNSRSDTHGDTIGILFQKFRRVFWCLQTSASPTCDEALLTSLFNKQFSCQEYTWILCASIPQSQCFSASFPFLGDQEGVRVTMEKMVSKKCSKCSMVMCKSWNIFPVATVDIL